MIRAQFSAGVDHLPAQVPDGEIGDELAGFLDVSLGMFHTGAGEHDHGRAFGHSIEETVGRMIDNARRAHAGNPADGPRHHQRLERIERQAVVTTFSWTVMHRVRRV